MTSKGKICTPLKEQLKLKELGEDTQTTAIWLSVKAAQKLLPDRKVRLRWVACRLREQISLNRCFNCLLFGYFAKAWTIDIDRSDQWRRCGKNVDIDNEFSRVSKCMLCEGKEGQDNGHIAGSGKCREFRKALTALGKWSLFKYSILFPMQRDKVIDF